MKIDTGQSPRSRLFSSLLWILCLLPVFAAQAETIVIYGATGNIGSKIVTESLDRGHDVICVSRTPESLTVDHPNFSAVHGDASSLESMLEIIGGADAVVISVRGYGPNNYPDETLNYRSSKTFIAASRSLGETAPRVIHLGGGSTLYSNGMGQLRLNFSRSSICHWTKIALGEDENALRSPGEPRLAQQHAGLDGLAARCPPVRGYRTARPDRRRPACT